MTPKEFFRRVRELDRCIDQAQERAARLRSRLEGGRVSVPDGLPRAGAGDWTDTVGSVLALEEKIEQQIREMCRWKSVAMEAIASLDDPRLREVLELYYLDGYTWEEVARRMGYEQRQAYRLHMQALRRVRLPEDVIECQY